MGFYEEISQYYDLIFPAEKPQIEFLKKAAGVPPADILDIACGTAGYSIELAKCGYDVTASDIDEEMMKQAEMKTIQAGLNMELICSDMMTLSSRLQKLYDLVFCIGNSLVHLGGKEDILKFLDETAKILKPGGKAVFQIMNYDMVLSKKKSQLPSITSEDKSILFERYYRYENNAEKLYFTTVLTKGSESITNTIELIPLLSDEFITLLEKAGFSSIDIFGDFNFGCYEKYDSYTTVIVAGLMNPK